MKVEIKIDKKITETIAIIHAAKITPELLSLVETLEGLTEKKSLLVSKNDDKVYMIEPNDVDIIRTEGGILLLYDKQARSYSLSRTLASVLETLPSNFVRISKSTIINVNRVDHLSNSFNGTMSVVMKNGINDYITRNFLIDFKKRFGM